MNQELKQQLIPYILSAHQVVRDFLNSDDLKELVLSISERYFLEPDEVDSVVDLVCLILLGLIDPNSLKSELQKRTAITSKMATDFASDLQTIILEPIAKIIDRSPFEEKSSGVVNSFEKTILNQVNAMRPIGEDESNDVGNGATPTQNNVPHNLPGIEVGVDARDTNSTNSKNAIHNYVPGGDPYREPIG